MENKYLAHHAKTRRKRAIDLNANSNSNNGTVAVAEPTNTTTNPPRRKRPRTGRANGATRKNSGAAERNYAEKSTANGSYKKYQVRRGVGASDPRLSLLDRIWALNSDARIADIGCNDGAFTTHLARRYPNAAVTGFELDATLVARATRSARGVKYEVRDVCATPLPESHYDLILALSVSKWLHFRSGDDGLRKFFHDVYRALRPNGVFVLEPQPMKSYKLARKKGAVPAHMTCDKFKFKPEHFVDFLVKEVGFGKVATLRDAESTPKNTPFGTRPVYAFFKTAPLPTATPTPAPTNNSKIESDEKSRSTSTNPDVDSQCDVQQDGNDESLAVSGDAAPQQNATKSQLSINQE